MPASNPTVRVYRNLHRNCLSIQARTASGWRVVAHAFSVELEGVAFKVSQAGRDRTLRTGQKVVHAFAVGTLAAWSGSLTIRHDEPLAAILGLPGAPLDAPADRVKVSYNPKRLDSFHLADGAPVRGCAALHMLPSRSMAQAPELAIL